MTQVSDRMIELAKSFVCSMHNLHTLIARADGRASLGEPDRASD